MHHRGSLWVRSAGSWRMYVARAGIEWSLQFCADPAKVDRLRQDALTLVNAFPETLPALTVREHRAQGPRPIPITASNRQRRSSPSADPFFRGDL